MTGEKWSGGESREERGEIPQGVGDVGWGERERGQGRKKREGSG